MSALALARGQLKILITIVEEDSLIGVNRCSPIHQLLQYAREMYSVTSDSFTPEVKSLWDARFLVTMQILDSINSQTRQLGEFRWILNRIFVV